MPYQKITTDPPIFPKRLDPVALERLCDELYAVQQAVFDGVDRDSFRDYVLCPDNHLTKLFLFRNAQGTLVGYLTFQVFELSKKDRPGRRRSFLYRTETGLLRPYRGKAPIFRILVSEIWKFSLRHGIPKAYFVATPINPVAYLIAERNTAVMYPRPGKRLSKQNLNRMAHIAGVLGISDASDPAGGVFLAKVGWKVRMDQRFREKVERCDSPSCRFYLAQNPRFADGHGLLVVAPATLSNGIRTALKGLGRRLKRRWGFRRRLSWRAKNLFSLGH